jgi:hypothetical protein
MLCQLQQAVFNVSKEGLNLSAPWFLIDARSMTLAFLNKHTSTSTRRTPPNRVSAIQCPVTPILGAINFATHACRFQNKLTKLKLYRAPSVLISWSF